MKRIEIFKQIDAERERQDFKFSQQNHSPIEWCAILGEEVGEVNKAALEHHFKYIKSKGLDQYRKELIQTAAVCVSMIESLDRNELKQQSKGIRSYPWNKSNEN